MRISEVRMPTYLQDVLAWNRWRICYEGGDYFISTYLERFSTKETTDEFDLRRNLTYAPTFAKTAINEIRDSIIERLCDVSRVGGSEAFQEAVKGKNGGVDFDDSSMDYFIGSKILPELLVMKQVGVYVDKAQNNGRSLASNKGIRPYVYHYKIEDILAIDYIRINGQKILTNLLLAEDYECREFGFVVEYKRRYRHVQRVDAETISVKFYNDEDVQIDMEGEPTNEEIILKLPKIPFYIASISESLMKDIDKYQIALLNIESSDINFILKANFPFYIEQYNPLFEQAQFRQTQPDGEGTAAEASQAKTTEVKIGVGRGRRYGMDLEAPAFINPSSEPLMASMEKQKNMKEDIRHLVRLTVSNLKGPKMASAESKKEDSRSLETGLSYIGAALQECENQIAQFWTMYENKTNAAEIIYPRNYSLKSEEDRQKEVEHLDKMCSKIPSKTFQKEVFKRISKIMLEQTLTENTLTQIYKEISSSEVLVVDSKTLLAEVEAGLCSTDLASRLRGYPEGEAEKAEADRAKRLATIAMYQSKAMGVRGVESENNDSQVNNDDPSAPPNKRGKADGNNQDS